MFQRFARRLLSPIVELREEEAGTALLMFLYSFLAMTGYNIVKPITRSKFISDLGPDNLPYVQLVAGVVVGILMIGYAWMVSRLPRRWSLPITQGLMALLLLGFWVLFQEKREWVSVAFYLVGLILGVLLISQFWTLANVVYDPRQAKRVFGFIGGGAPLGGIAGSAILTGYAQSIGTINLLLVSAASMVVCLIIVTAIIKREPTIGAQLDPTGGVAAKEKGVGLGESIQLLRQSRHLQIIAMVIGFAAVGAAIIEQQLNMAAAASKGQTATDSITAFLGQVQLWTSSIGLVIQIWLTSRVHRLLGIGFALLILPVSLGTTGIIMLLNAVLWAPAIARVADQSLRYTIDKTTREILFLPLPADIKYKAKPFVDVTVDRFAKGLGAVILLVLIKPWGLNLDWQHLSYASLAVTALWIFMALRARREYLASFRRSIERHDMEPAEMRLNVADLSTVEALLEELASPDERRVLYSIDVLESLQKKNLVTPLLLYHSSPAVRARALKAVSEARPDIAEQWLPSIERMIADESPQVRRAAIGALAQLRGEKAGEAIRSHLADPDPRVVATAAAALARSSNPSDLVVAEAALTTLATDTRESAAKGRKEVATAIGQLADPRFNHLLVPLLYDADPRVTKEALRSARELGPANVMFVPALVSTLRHRAFKSEARDVLVSYGEGVLDALGHFLRDREEEIWIRRHLPSTIARIPSQKSLDLLVEAMADPDGFLRYKAVVGIERLRQERPELTFAREAIEARVLREGMHYFNYLSLHYNLFYKADFSRDSLLAAALEQKMGRTVDRIYRLLGLIYPWKDVVAARWALEHGDARARASAAEYLDNILGGQVRKRIMPILEDAPITEKVSKANVALRTRPRDVEETLLQLINDDDQVVSAAAINLVKDLKLWSLADDLEHVLAHRDAGDWFVFEATSWALAVYRVPEEKRRALWLEPLPTVELAARLRKLPIFASVSVDELFRIAAPGRQVRVEAGQVIYSEGAAPDAFRFLIDGRVSLRTRAGEAIEVTAPEALGFEELLQASAMSATARAIETSVILVVSASDALTLLSDNTDLVRGLFTMLIDRGTLKEDGLVVRGSAAAEVTRLGTGGLTPIQKVLVLQCIPVFSRVTAEDMLQLASIAREVPLQSGAVLVSAADPAAMYAVVCGEITVALTDREIPEAAGPSDAIFVRETLAGVSKGRSATVKTPGLALRIGQEDLFDLLEQHETLLRQIFGALFQGDKRERAVSSSRF